MQLQDRWCSETNKMRLYQDTIPKFSDFAKLVKTEATTATDPVFSHNALGSLPNVERATGTSKGLPTYAPPVTSQFMQPVITTTGDENETATPFFQCNNVHRENEHASRKHRQ